MHADSRSQRSGAVPGTGITGIGCDVEQHRVIGDGLRASDGRWAVRVLAAEELHRISSRPPRLWGGREVLETAELWTAKEAVAKALGVEPGRPWRWSDVIVGPQGPGTGERHVRLVGTAAGAGDRGGIGRISVRTGRSADRSWATAVATAATVPAPPQQIHEHEQILGKGDHR